MILPTRARRFRFPIDTPIPKDPRAGVKRIFGTLFIVSSLVFAFLSFFKPPLPPKEEILKEVLENEPVQGPLEEKELTREIGGFEYRLKILHSYEIWGLVVSQYNSANLLDVFHRQDPGNIKDICVVWGENITSDAYRKIGFKSGEFTCYYFWKGVGPGFYESKLANNHLIPKEEEISSLIRSAEVGDQVHIKGYLANYRVYKDGKEIFTRATSTTRDDTGNGACEIIYVEGFEILRETNRFYTNLRVVSFYSLIASLLFWLGLVLF